MGVLLANHMELMLRCMAFNTIHMHTTAPDVIIFDLPFGTK